MTTVANYRRATHTRVNWTSASESTLSPPASKKESKQLACSRLSVVGDGEKGRAREKNEGGLRRGREALVLPRFFLARFRSSPTTESLEQATKQLELKTFDVVLNT